METGSSELILNSPTLFFSSSYPHIFETNMTLGSSLFFFFYLFLFYFISSALDLCDAMRRCWLLYTVIIQFMSGAQRSTSLLLTFLDPWIIKMPQAMHSSCKLFLVLHLAPTSHFGTARSDHLRKVQIRCFLHKHLSPLPSFF